MTDSGAIRPDAIRLETPRLVMRLGTTAEAAAVVDYQLRNREHFGPWDPRRTADFFTEAWWVWRLSYDRDLAAQDRSYRLLCFDASEARVIGHVSFANVVRGAFWACHLGFGLDVDHVGQGLMHEALSASVPWAFETLHMHRIEANHRPENARSGALLERLGFVPQGYARDYLLIDGAWRDHVLTAITNPRWRPAPE